MSNLKAFGYTREDLKVILKPMAEDGKEPAGSMGNDTPHAFLSRKPQLLYNYFKQLFAQVTNPAIDSIREKLVMSLESFIGPERNILEETPGHSHKIRVKNPILTNEEFKKIRDISINGFKSKTIYTFFDRRSGREGFVQALDRISFEAEYAIEKGFSFIILSDRGADSDNVALPSLLAASAVHQHLVKKTIRSQVALIIESAEPREVHHLALLFGYGADCVNPYLAYEAIEYLIIEKELQSDARKALKNYNKALRDGILKILSKMGISTLRSYRSAQIFEALGLDDGLIEKYFTGTISRIGGVSLEGIAEETIARHEEAYPETGIDRPYLASGGVYQWKKDDGTVLQSQSGYGKQSITLKGNIVPRPYYLMVTATSRDGSAQGESLTYIAPQSPSITFYKDDPLYGPLFNQAVGNTLFIGAQKEVRAFASLFGFNTSSNISDALTLDWSINGTDHPELASSRSIVLRAPSGVAGTSNIALNASGIDNILQGANASFIAAFSAGQSATSTPVTF